MKRTLHAFFIAEVANDNTADERDEEHLRPHTNDNTAGQPYTHGFASVSTVAVFLLTYVRS